MVTRKEIFTDCTLCYHSCGTKVTVEDGKAVKIRGLESHPLNKGRLCPKGARALDVVYSPDRLRQPLKRIDGEFEEIAWDQALDEIAEKLTRLKREYGPQVFGFFCGSIGVENLEMSTLVHLLRSGYGTPNFFSVESICYRMRIRTRQMTFGRYPTEEPDSNLYILWGHNPDQSDFPLKFFMKKNLKKGAKLVVIDPKRIPMADQADMYLRIRPGTDGALALAMLNVIIEQNLYDREFVEKHTTGFDKLVPHVKPFTPEWAQELTWIPADDIRALAKLFASTKGASIFQGTCTQDQTANGTQNSRAFAVLQTITGNINVPGGWVTSPPPRFGHPGYSVEGMPLGGDQYPLFYDLWGRKAPYGVVTLVPESIPEKLKAFLVIGGNPLISMPDSKAFKAAFEKLDLLVVHDLFMTATAQAAHYVLPACSHLEKWGIAYTYNVCHCLPFLMLRKQCIEPLHASWSEWRFLTELGHRLGMSDSFPWKTEKDFVSFMIEPSGLSFDYLLNQKPEGDFYAEKKYTNPEGFFRTPSKKIEIYSDALEQVGFDPLPSYLEPERGPERGDRSFLEKYPLILSVGNRNLYYTHSQHHQVEALQKLFPDPLAEIGSETAQTYGLADGDPVVVETNRGQVTMKARVDDRVAEGIVLVPHGWGGQANANLLTDVACREPIMGYPDQKSLQCRIRKA
ncbi:MAG: molybdopterin-dependent oxidoreductase [Deltaproteobacteria bacterium]|jgi:anaerobic selenocysteine-containing dehydrogenase|nr:molybdopterin-dependent oxidoreductase [Deltaproteobacteria bacterium]MBW2483707.1 molybdopterin-dependent oxidoreductase [Deltaproteobacteria bacterium]